jgi:excisionase family DNA binding protein
MSPTSTPSDQLLSGQEAAKFLGITYHTLAVWKCNKRYALPYVKVGRLVKYRRADLEAFIEKNRFGGEDAHAK